MKVYIFGLGHIGLPIACWIALKTGGVYGIDKNSALIQRIRSNNVNIHEYYEGKHISQLAYDLLNKKQLMVSTEFCRQDNEAAIFIITVGISPNPDGTHNFGPLNEVLDTVLPALVKGDLLIFKTTMVPGTCEKLIVPQLKALNVPVHLAYCPETIAEGKAFDELDNNPRILAALDDESYQKAEEFFSSLSNAPIIKAPNFRTAEMAKVVQNITRDVNVALINELSEAAKALNIDVYALRELCNSHPRVELLQPGPGVGGFCLPNALGYLLEAFPDKKKAPADLMRTARSVNEARPPKIVSIIKDALKEQGKSIKNSLIAISGLAMKDNCADFRNSPALEIANLLITEGAKIQAYDPLLPLIFPFQVDSFEDCIKNADCLLITAMHNVLSLDVEMINHYLNPPAIVIDTRNSLPDTETIKLYRG